MTIRPIITVVSVAVLTGCGSGARPLTLAHNGWVTTTVRSDTTFDVSHPAAWRYIRAINVSQGPVGTIGYLSTQPDQSGCNTINRPNGTSEIACRPPVSALHAGGVLVEINGEGMPVSSAFPVNDSVDGQGVLIQNNPSSECPHGATGSEEMRALVPFPGAIPPTFGLLFLACYNQTGSNANLAAEVDEVMRGIHFR